MHPVYSDAFAADQILDWDHDDYYTLDARKFGSADLGTGATVTYGFLGTGQNVDVDADQDEFPLTAAQEAVFEEALQLIMDVCDLTFVEWSGAAAPFAQLQAQAWDRGGGRTPPVVTAREGEADLLGSTTVNADGDNYNLRLVLHEIGHGIGLYHPGAYDGAGFNYDDHAHYFQDSQQFTLMSYWSGVNTGANYGRVGSSTLKLHDILALQKLYGANETAFSGDTTYGFGSNTLRSPWTMEDAGDDMFGAIYDTGGHDLINLSFLDTDSDVDLRQGAFSSTGAWLYNFAIAFGTVIEDLMTGDGDDRLIGNGADNWLWAGDGDDSIWGYGGDDHLVGRSGNDLLVGGGGGDTIDGGLGRDTTDYSAANGGMSINLTAGTAERLSGSSVDELISIEDVYGSGFGDVMTGNASANYLTGRQGDDVIRGRGYNDRIEGEQGDDTLYGGNGEDTVFGGTGNDHVSGGGGDDYLDGQSGIDVVDYSGSNADWVIDLSDQEATRSGVTDVVRNFEDVIGGGGDDLIIGTGDVNDLEGGDGNDTIIGRGGADLLRGQGDDDTVFGGNGDDTAIGGDGADSLAGGNGDDFLRGGAGADMMRGNAGADRYQGGTGSDTVSYDDSDGPWFVDLETGLALNGFGTAESLSSIENLIGSRGGDRLLGDDGANHLRGDRGDDSISGRNGNDVIEGDDGADTLSGGLGNDRIMGGNGVDEMNGGSGNDRVDYSYSNGGWVIDLQAEQATSNSGTVEIIENFESVYGAQGFDTILGERGANDLQGLAGNDSIDGREGDDAIFGGAGDDTLAGGADNDLINGGGGTDQMDGGDGVDTVDYSYSGSAWQIDLAASTATRVGGGSEVIRRFENAYGGRASDEIAGNDDANLLVGRNGGDTLIGRGGDDELSGGRDDDRLFGGDGNDALYGGADDDWFYGGAGRDDHYGGAGRDFFIFVDASESVGLSRDVIRADSDGVAFERGFDLISLAGIDADTSSRLDDAFRFGGTGAGRIELRDSINGYTVVEGYTDTGQAADFLLLIEDGDRLAAEYTAADFIL